MTPNTSPLLIKNKCLDAIVGETTLRIHSWLFLHKRWNVKKITDLDRYKNQLYLELCLSMVEDAYQHVTKQEHDLARAQLKDILDTFDRCCGDDVVDSTTSADVIPFPPR